MASPDFRPYVDLTLSDLNVNNVYAESIEYAKTNFPELSPRQGTIENAILEATAYVTTSMVTAVNRLPDGLMEGLLKLMGFSRVEATAATATATFDVTINTGVTIVLGTVVSYDVYDDDGILTQFLFETTDDLVIPAGNTAGTVSLVAVSAGEYPDIPVGEPLTLVSSTPYVLDVTLSTITSVGADTETDTEYFTRAVAYLASLSNCITTQNQLSNYLGVTYPTVARFKVYDLTDSADMSTAAADDPGNVTIALCDSTGGPISGTQKTIIEDDVESKVVAGLQVHLHDMDIFTVDVAIDVTTESNYSTAAVSTAVTDAVEAYLSVSGWDFADQVNANRITSIASKVPGVKYVTAVTLDLGWAHADCVVATTANVNLSTDLENGDVLNGVTLATNNRVLVKNQSTASQNGIYVVQASGAAVRATDANASSEFVRGSFVFVTGGTTGSNTGWILTNTGTITLGSTALTFEQFDLASVSGQDIDLDMKGAIPIGNCTTTAT